MRLGLLGCGSVAHWIHGPAIRGIPGATLVGAADPDPRARARVARALGTPVCERAEDLLARSDIDAVVICVPTYLHADLAIAAAASGKHLYLEKPLATTLADARAVIEAVSRAGVTAAVGFNRRLHPLFEQARRLLASGAIGRVSGVQAAFCEPAPAGGLPDWKRRRSSGGGALLDLASHHVDHLRWTLGEEIAAASASIRSDSSEHDSARLELETESGVSVQGYFSFRGGLADHLEFVGERGTLRVDRHSAELSVRVARRRGYGTRRRWVAPSPATLAWRLERLWRPAADPSYRRSLRAFIECCRGGPAGPTASLADGLRSLEVVLAAEEAAAGGRVAPVERRETGACASC